MKIVCVGDSLTYGYRVPRRKVWTALAAERAGMEVLNRGVTGDTTGGMLARFGRDALDARPDAVFLMGGVNDLIMGAGAGVVHANLSAMVHQAFAAGCAPVLGVPIPLLPDEVREDWRRMADFPSLVGAVRELREWLGLFARTFGVQLVDFYTLFTGLGEAIGEYYLDGMHPNLRGNGLMADRFCAELAGKLRRARP